MAEIQRPGVPFIGHGGLQGRSAGEVKDGIITFETALPEAYAKAYCFLMPDVLFEGSPPGYYRTAFTSTTQGNISNERWTPNGDVAERPVIDHD
jgi:hypothetical protein